MKFSVKTQGFYPSDIDYGDSLPTDAETITNEQYVAFFDALNTSAANFVVVYNDGGGMKLSPVRPDAYHYWDAAACEWVIIDAAQQQKKADQISAASLKKSQLLDEATKSIAPLQDAVDLDIATDDEKSQLTAWKKYRVLLNRVDTSIAPGITWPEKPTL
ncbi:tail fiber assembly protein [Dickeya solani]|uniref:Tail fiber assembly protein n=1 Tax=Dickeya solani TaxID=1089444 RepID=A0ABU4EHC8_9GAMM|nr:tail fiber assembly protein [Dickeya solani]MCZ0823721.1 tail fiber assembly protein [Dickeya solani]MDV6995628.1 tail fiber assembly protein [Dickeya solani]MDV7002907.1 tail fiber assembly protein [Dickeya solani]MDV7036683.1 tail fiber assembly protein [Dickeya solani]MDV7043436.1 tail fiber assembly protein [Dickeya solani]